MQKISFDNGFKTYQINDDENAVIKINTRDYAILERLNVAMRHLEEWSDKYKEQSSDAVDETNSILHEADAFVRNEINSIFDADVAQVVFGKTNCLTLCENGNMLVENFLNAIVPIIKSDFEKAHAASNKKIKKYTSQVKK